MNFTSSFDEKCLSCGKEKEIGRGYHLCFAGATSKPLHSQRHPKGMCGPNAALWTPKRDER